MTGLTGIRRRLSRNRGGFSILEIAIVVALMGLLSAMALPSFMRARRASKIAAMVSDLRTIHDSFNMYAMDNRGFPTGHGFVPQPVTAYLSNARWGRPTTLGGRWLYYDVSTWPSFRTYLLVVDDFRIDAGRNPLAPTDWWLEVDRRIDDGDLSSGTFRLVSGIQVQYSLESRSW